MWLHQAVFLNQKMLKIAPQHQDIQDTANYDKNLNLRFECLITDARFCETMHV